MSEYLSSCEDPGDKKDTAETLNKILEGVEDRNETPKTVTEAWHTARDDAEKSGDLQRGSAPGSGGQGGKK